MNAKHVQPPTPEDAVEDIERDDAVIGAALRWSGVLLAVLLAVGGIAAYLLTRPQPAPPERKTDLAQVEVRETATIAVPTVPFTDVTEESGIDFLHVNGAAGRKLLPETMGGGCAVFDFDADGDQDLLLVNSQGWADDPDPAKRQATSALYRNDGTGRFENVTAGSGLDVPMYGMGAAVGDYDNDGLVDVYITAVGPNRLFRNLGAGKFQDVTGETGTAGDPGDWGTSAGWFDFDNDGDLDLFVCNYVVWTKEFDVAQNFQLVGGDRAYGRPQNFEGTFPDLYRNDGEGKFTEVAEAAGLQVRNPATNVPMAKSLGVTFADLDGDGGLEIVVANDTVQNFLFRNRRDGTFEEIGAIAGVAFDMNGAARGAMGISAAHFRNNDAIGLAIGNFANEMTALYVSRSRDCQFVDEAISTGLGPNTRLELTFGVLFLDYDLDGRLDLFAANGHLEQEINRVQPSQHYEQAPQLFWNCGVTGDTEFLPVPADQLTEDFRKPLVGRGAACADFDGDGDLDLVVMSVGQRPRLLRNDRPTGHHWLRFKLEGVQCHRDAIGAEVEVQLADRTLRRTVMPTCSYCSQTELPLTFGLGSVDQVKSVTVRWPDGTKQTLSDVALDRQHLIKQAP